MRQNKWKIILTAILFCVAATMTNSCKKSDTGSEMKISRHGGSESHKTGQDCISCHRSGGSGTGWFSVAGSVFEADGTTPAPNGMVILYNQPNNADSQVMAIEVDGRGNFYTTETLEFNSGLYTSASSSGGADTFMQTPVTSGACNQCHNGVTTEVIKVN